MALHLFSLSLPSKLDSLEKIQAWYYGDKKRINLYLSETYSSFTKGSISVSSGQRAVKGASPSIIYSAKVSN